MYIFKVFAIVGFLFKVDAFDPKSRVTTFRKTALSFYNDHRLTADEAEAECKKYEGFLAHVKNMRVQEFIASKLVYYKIDKKPSESINKFYIGLYQVGNDLSKWKWSDNKELYYENWYYSEPNKVSDRCVAIELTTSSYPIPFGFWSDCNCKLKKSFVCQNDFGSSFISKKAITLDSNGESIICTVVGSGRYTARWKKNDLLIPAFTDKAVYQKYNVEKDIIRTSTIVFADASLTDKGFYSCVIEKKETVSKIVFVKSHKVTVEKIEILSSAVEVVKAVIKDGVCVVDYTLPKAVEGISIDRIHVRLSETDDSTSTSREYSEKFRFKENSESLEFKTKTGGFTYRGHILLECCKGIYGKKSEDFECQKEDEVVDDSTGIPIFMYILLALVALVLITSLGFLTIL